jgi:YD repeat-containing protein
VTVTSKKGSELISKNKYQYFTKQKAGGEEWTYKLISDVDGDQTETTYNECCGLPVLIKQGGQETRFEYDIKGHITKKTTPYQVTELHYDPVINKVDRVNKYSIKNRKKAIWSQFEYDSKGNLIIAKSSDGRGVRLVYDNLGRIKSMMDQSKELINFKYNELSKPIEISDPALGTISVSYSNSGELKEVRSQGGPKVAAQVTASFQSLLDIVKPAGVTLAF